MSELIIDGSPVFRNPGIVLFDKDGTLIDIHHYWVSMIKIRSALIVERYFSDHRSCNSIHCELVDAMGVNSTTGKMKSEGPVGIKPRPFIVNVAAEVVRLHGTNISNDEMEMLFAEVDRQTSENMLPLLRLLPGALELLENLKQHRVLMALVSTDITSRARMAMETLKLDHFFNIILGGDSVANTKPLPDLALKAMSECRSHASGAVVIGDHPVDIEMGESAECGLNIGVLTGLSARDAFEELNCTVIPDLTCVEVRS